MAEPRTDPEPPAATQRPATRLLTPVTRPRTVAEVLDAVLDVDPDRTALLSASAHMTYAQLDAAANAAAAALAASGVRPGDRVAACLPNDTDIVIAFHGAMRLGALWVGVNRALAPAEKEELLGACAPSLLLATPDVVDAHAARWRSLAVDPDHPERGWPAALAAAAGASRPPAVDPEAPAAIAFTSGTTGAPKGIVHSQRNLLLPGAALVVSRSYDAELVKGDCLPLTILNMQVLTTLLTAQAGGCCALTDRRDAHGVAQWIARDRVTVWNGVPAILYSLVHDTTIAPALLASLREVWTGGAPCPEEIVAGFRSRFGLTLRQTYGLTEAPTVVSIDPVGDDGRVPGASGVPLPHLRVAVRDGAGAALPTGEIGEIVIAALDEGPWAGAYRPALGRWTGDSVELSDSAELATGDIGRLDEEGNLFVVDRKKLLIIRGGANVYPAEVERVIDRLAGVRGSAVIGLADDRLGQRVVAVVEADGPSAPEPAAVVAHCGAHLARYKVPEQVVVVDELPRNAMGKVNRAPLAGLFRPDRPTSPSSPRPRRPSGR